MPSTLDGPPIIELPPLVDFPGLHEQLLDRSGIGGPWIVIVYNDEIHSFEEVQDILQEATGCDVDTAWHLTVKIDAEGRAIVYDGSEDECELVAKIIASIRLQVETDRA
jgi:ATP-dependent Clp protease adaptor protein ClpS